MPNFSMEMRPGGSGVIASDGSPTRGPDQPCRMVTLSLQSGTAASVGIGEDDVGAGEGIHLAAAGSTVSHILVGNLNQISVAAGGAVEVGFVYWV